MIIMKKKIPLICIITIIIGIILLFMFFLLKPNNTASIGPTQEELTIIKQNAKNIINKNTEISSYNIDSSNNDESAILVKGKTLLTLKDSIIIKSDGQKSDKENFLLYYKQNGGLVKKQDAHRRFVR